MHYADPRISHYACTKECTHSEFWWDFGMRPRSWLDVGPKSWFTECMGIQESACTLVPKDALIRNFL